MRGKLIAIVTLAATLAQAQTVFVRTNEISGNVSASEALTGPAGAYRFTLHSTDGGSPTNLAGRTIKFAVRDTYDNKLVVSNTATTVDSTNGVFRGEGTLSVRQNPAMADWPYDVQFIAEQPSVDPLVIYWSSLALTQAAASASATINVTNEITVGAVTVESTNTFYYSNTFENAFSVTNEVTVNNTVSNTFAAGAFSVSVMYTAGVSQVSVVNGAGSVENGWLYLTNLPGVVSNVLLGTSNAWDAGIGQLIINTSEVLAGSGLITTNAVGELGYDNAAGSFVEFRPGPRGTTGIAYDYITPHAISNRNIGAWSVGVSNGYLVATAPGESVVQLRACDVRAITGTGPWRASVTLQPPPVAGPNTASGAEATYYMGIGMQTGHTGVVQAWMMYIRGAASSSLLGHQWSELSSFSGAMSGGTTALPSNPNWIAVSSLSHFRYPLTFLVDYDGASTLRLGLSLEQGIGAPLTYTWIGSKTNSSQQRFIFPVFVSAGSHTNPVTFMASRFWLEEGAQW